MYKYPFKLEKLINEISKLPSVGPRMAERMALYILKKSPDFPESLSGALLDIKDVVFCGDCFNVSDSEKCSICLDGHRDRSIICIVESPEDIITVERTTKFRGYYHVLHGLVNPLGNILPEDLKISELSERINKDEEELKEVILAINHTVEGDATCLYINETIKETGRGIKVSRLAKGLPTGSDIKYADEITLGQAIVERKEM
ncbi:MAG TPA: recombination protein RecR [Firmicutes bacterium]|nr:recombination protein RecR [Bacillota bacterium]